MLKWCVYSLPDLRRLVQLGQRRDVIEEWRVAGLLAQQVAAGLPVSLEEVLARPSVFSSLHSTLKNSA